jgi:polysaccharide export outer membrane protein
MSIIKTQISWGAAILGFLLGTVAVTGQPQTTAELNLKDPGLQTRSLAALRGMGMPPGEEYTIGDGDEIEIQVVNRPELSGHHLVGPDGRITLPFSGPFEIKNLSRDAAAKGIEKSFEKYYTSTDVTVRVTKYGSNRILVLGHVARPGVLYFDNTPTLLEALSKSGAGTTKGKDNDPSLPQRCAIFRGKDLMAWIDLKEMLDRGDSLADLRLKRDDVLYVPDEQEVIVSVLGEVQRPGMVKLEHKSNLLDVVALSGGLTPEAGKARIEVVRADHSTREFAFHDLLNPAKTVEFPLQRGDVIYVEKGGVAKFEYTLKKLGPLGTMMLFGSMLGASLQ